MTKEQLETYDHLINTAECDWDLFYWSVGKTHSGIQSVYYLSGEKEPPEEYKSDILEMLQHHAKNYGRDLRNQQPDIRSYTE